MPLLAFGHVTWIDIVSSQKKIVIGHGHHYPKSEECPNPASLAQVGSWQNQKFAKLTLAREAHYLSASLPADPPAMAFFSQNPVIYTRTTRGMKIGPKSQFSNVVDSFRKTVSGKSLTDLKAGMIPAGLPAELLVKKNNDTYEIYFIMAQKPVFGASISYCLSGSDAEQLLGKTDAYGQVKFKPGKKGNFLITGSFRQDSPNPDCNYELVETTLTVKLE